MAPVQQTHQDGPLLASISRAVVRIVHEYTGLRVCDASIFPDIPSANLAMPTMMVADHIAQLIIDGS